jgi:beta-galactosidase/beta-glucuronidase
MTHFWKPAGCQMLTRWGRTLDPQHVLPEYPRPHMTRPDWQNLNGLWDFAVTVRETPFPNGWEGKILVPFCIESALSGVGRALEPHERLWYRRIFQVAQSRQGQHVLLHFGAVDWECQVWVNGQELGVHRGGYDPFTFDITGALNPTGDQELVVAVWDPTDTGHQERGKQSLDPHFVLYSAVSGIWQTVWLEVVPQVYIESIQLTPSIDPTGVTVSVTLNDPSANGKVTISAFIDGKVVTAQGVVGEATWLGMPGAHLWSPEQPTLYDLEIALVQDGIQVDRVGSYVGLREVRLITDEAGIPRVQLNRKTIFQMGVLDQGYYPDGLYTPPSDEAMLSDIQAAKSLGLNMLRKHIKVEPARWYLHCDRLGMLVWQDMPNGGKIPGNLVLGAGFLLGLSLEDTRRLERFGRQDAAVREAFTTELTAMVKTLYNHPCIITWVPFNESWGQFESQAATDLVRQMDTTRMIDSASGWFDQGAGDFKSIHKYVGPAMPRLERRRAAALTEFGGLGYVVEGHTWTARKPFAYRIVKDKAALTAAYVKLMQQLEPMISKGLIAAIYTELTDVEYEVNGYLTYDREEWKLDPQVAAAWHRRLTGQQS